jgi:RNA 3'-terminal phosphate cyclase-like protein
MFKYCIEPHNLLRPIKITNIRLKDEMPGLRDYEVSLLKLVEKVTNGSTIIINETGTALQFNPGQLTGGKVLHECAQSRSVIYYLEVVAAMAPLCKDSLILQLRGCTHDANDNSVDIFRSVTVPLLQKLGVANSEEAQLSFKVVSRGYGANSSGSIIFTCPTIRCVPPVEQVKEGLVKRVRGVFWSAKMNREFSVRFVESARSILNKCIEDVWVYTENVKESSKPVYGASLMSETDYGFFKGVSWVETDPSNAEALGKTMAKRLLSEIEADGIVDQTHQWLVCLYMALSQDHKVSRATIGSEISSNCAEFMRNIQKFLLVRFKMSRLDTSAQNEEDQEVDTPTAVQGAIQLECIGINMTNTARKAA